MLGMFRKEPIEPLDCSLPRVFLQVLNFKADDRPLVHTAFLQGRAGRNHDVITMKTGSTVQKLTSVKGVVVKLEELKVEREGVIGVIGHHEEARQKFLGLGSGC